VGDCADRGCVAEYGVSSFLSVKVEGIWRY
jgi:hypothetical protein